MDKILMGSEFVVNGVHYRICGIIGEGGAAVVYLAQDHQNRNFALKMVKNYSDPVSKAMVDSEIRIQKELSNNKHVIQCLGYEQIQKTVFIVLELGECSLRNWIDASREISQKQFLNVICDVCQGLSYIHNKKMIHRDIKPENIIKKDNIYKITDFGVSCEHEQDSSISGTPMYWAPEMLTSENNNMFTNKVDVWSLGVTMFEVYFKVNPFCPTKKLPFRKAIEEIKLNIAKLTPNFTIDKFISYLKQEDRTEDLAFVERKMKNSDRALMDNLCLFFEPNPDNRPDIDLLFMLFDSLKTAQPKVKKTQKNPNIKTWQEIPQDIRLFCRAKDLFYEISSFYKTKLFDKVLFALELAIWYLEGANYEGADYIKMQKLQFLKQYRKPSRQLWQQIKTMLSQYYFYLKCEQQVKNYQKLDQLKLHILMCSVWNQMLKDDNKFCKMIFTVTGFQIGHTLKVFQYSQLFSDRNLADIEERIINKYYL